MSKFDDDDYNDYDDEDLEDDDDDDGGVVKKSSVNPFGSGQSRPPLGGSGLTPNPSGVVGSGAPRPPLGGAGSGGGLGAPRPPLPGSPPAGGGSAPPGSNLGASRMPAPGSLGSSSPPGGGGLGMPPRSPLPGSPPAGGGGGGGSLGGGGIGAPRTPLPGSPPAAGASNPGSPLGGGAGPKPSDPPKAADAKPAEDKNKGGMFGGFGKKPEDASKDKDDKASKPSGSALGGLGGFAKNLTSGIGGAKAGDDKAAKPSDDKKGNPLGSLASKLPFGTQGGEKDKAKDKPPKDDKPSGGMLSGIKSPFGGKKEDAAPPPASAPAARIGGMGGAPPGGGPPPSMGGAPRPGGAPPAASIPPAGAKPAAPKAAKAEKEGGVLGRITSLFPFGGKKDAKPTKARASKPVKVEQGGLSLDTKLDILGVALTIVALVLLLSSLSPNQGAITGEINRFLSYLFGWGAVAIPILVLGVGVWLILRHFGENAPTLEIPRVIGLAMLMITILTIMQFVEAFNYPPNALALIPQFMEASRGLGRGGGLIGGEIYLVLLTAMGEIGGFVILLIPLIVGTMLALSLSAAELAMIIVSNVRNLRDGARRRAIRAAAERVKREEQRALALQQAQAAQLTAGKPAMDALPAGVERPALPTPSEAPIPMQMPLAASQEQRSIPIMQGGRTVTASFVPGEDRPSAPAPDVKPAAAEKREEPPKTGLGRLIPGAVVGGALGSAVKALTPTEEDETNAPKPAAAKPGGILGGLSSRLPFGGKKPDAPDASLSAPSTPSVTPTAPGPTLAPKPTLPTAPTNPAAPAATAPAAGSPPVVTPPAPPVRTPAPTIPASPAASLSPTSEPVVRPTPIAPTTAMPGSAQSAEERPARLGDLLGAKPPLPGTGTPPAPTRPADTNLKPTPISTSSENRPLGTTPPLPASASAPKPPLAGSPPPPAKPILDDFDEEEEEDDLDALLASMTPAQPKGDVITSKPTESPFAPRVMQPRAPDGSGEPKPAVPPPAAASAPTSSFAMGTVQERMAALRGKLPGETAPSDSTDEQLPKTAGPLTPRPLTPLVKPEPPRSIEPKDDLDDEDDLDLDDEEDDLPIQDLKRTTPSTPPVSTGETPTPPSLRPNPFTPPVRPASPAFGKPDTPATSMPIPSRSFTAAPPPSPVTAPQPPQMPAAQTPAPQPPAARPPVAAPNPPPASAPPIIRTAAAPSQPVEDAGATGTIIRRGRKEWRMPEPSTLLATGSDQELDHALLLQRAKTIEETLQSFGAPGRVVEVRTGPVITQFGVEPDYLNARGGKKVRVKVSAIAQLDKDLQLALGAKSIRIEAPVPGKGYVGIEVPNDQASVVRLRDVMESEQFKKIKSPLAIALGQGVDGTPISADLTGMPHLLIAGTTGSGKSVCVNSIIASLLLNNTPERLKFIMVDPKRVELTAYNGIPHLVAPVVVELERIVGVLKWVTREMDDRYRKFSSVAARNIEDYNKHLPAGEPLMPYIVVIIDELADLMMLAPEETERVIARLAALARATGIHLVIATQRPSVDVITGLIKANFPVRIAFAVAGSVDSRVILDQPGAERLLGRGDMLYMSSDSPAPQRLQGVYVSDSEINNITRYWRTLMDDADLAAQGKPLLSDFKLDEMTTKEAGDRRGTTNAVGIGVTNTARQQAFWDRDNGPSSFVSSNEADEDENDSDDDDLYDQAVTLVRSLKKASVSLLQRRLRIGYTRAAKLIDLMEERGVVGPAQSGSTPREVIG